MLGNAGLRLQIGVIDRQWKVGERNARDLNAGLGELIGRDRGQLHIVRAGTQRAGNDEDSWPRHQDKFALASESAAIDCGNVPGWNAPDQSLRYTQTRAGGRFIQIRSEASVDTQGSDFGIGGATE